VKPVITLARAFRAVGSAANGQTTRGRNRKTGRDRARRAVGKEPAAPFYTRRVVGQVGERAAEVGDFSEGIGGGHELAIFVQRLTRADGGEVEQPLRRLITFPGRRLPS